MLRLTFVFFIWMASTAHALGGAADNQEGELHEAYVLAWNEADDESRKLLDRSQHAWSEYRDANCRLIGRECYALMAHERAAELRYILHHLTETNVRTILPGHGADRHSAN